MTRQQKRAAKQAETKNSPWKDVQTSPSPRDVNRQRYEAEKRRKADEAAKAATRIVGSLDAVTSA